MAIIKSAVQPDSLPRLVLLICVKAPEVFAKRALQVARTEKWVRIVITFHVQVVM
jgi:hypothetical protein